MKTKEGQGPEFEPPRFGAEAPRPVRSESPAAWATRMLRSRRAFPTVRAGSRTVISHAARARRGSTRSLLRRKELEFPDRRAFGRLQQVETHVPGGHRVEGRPKVLAELRAAEEGRPRAVEAGLELELLYAAERLADPRAVERCGTAQVDLQPGRVGAEVAAPASARISRESFSTRSEAPSRARFRPSLKNCVSPMVGSSAYGHPGEGPVMIGGGNASSKPGEHVSRVAGLTRLGPRLAYRGTGPRSLLTPNRSTPPRGPPRRSNLGRPALVPRHTPGAQRTISGHPPLGGRFPRPLYFGVTIDALSPPYPQPFALPLGSP